MSVHKTFRRRPGRVLNVLCTFNLSPVSTGLLLYCYTLRMLILVKLNWFLEFNCKSVLEKPCNAFFQTLSCLPYPKSIITFFCITNEAYSAYVFISFVIAWFMISIDVCWFSTLLGSQILFLTSVFKKSDNPSIFSFLLNHALKTKTLHQVI